MSSTSIPISMKDGLAFRPHEVENGLLCGCICLACRHPLIAANQGVKVEPYFRHAADSDCVRGYVKGVLLAARQALEGVRCFELPTHCETVTARYHGVPFKEEVSIASRMVTIDEVMEFGDDEADLTLFCKGHELNVLFDIRGRRIERMVRRLHQNECSALLIDLTGLNTADILDTQNFSKRVQDDLVIRSWIFSRVIQREKIHAQQRIDEKIDEFKKGAALHAAATCGQAGQRQQSPPTLDGPSLIRHTAAQPPRYTQAAQQAARRTAVQLRVRQIADSYTEVFHRHQGQGVLCGHCWFVMPAPQVTCIWCGRADKLTVQHIDAALTSTIQYRLNCNTRPDESLTVLPSLELFSGAG